MGKGVPVQRQAEGADIGAGVLRGHGLAQNAARKAAKLVAENRKGRIDSQSLAAITRLFQLDADFRFLRYGA